MLAIRGPIIPSGVIFDLDGVLLDSYAAHLGSWQRLGNEIGRAVTEAQFAATFGRRSGEVIREMFGVGDEAEVRRLDRRKEQVFRDLIREQVPLMPGADDAIRRLHAAGLRIAIGSSAPPENVQLVLDAMPSASLVGAIVTGADVTRGKPDPEVFQVAASRIDIPPPRCVVIEDAPAGIEAAHRAGMPAVALTGSHGHESLKDADQIIEKLDALTVALIESLTRRP